MGFRLQDHVCQYRPGISTRGHHSQALYSRSCQPFLVSVEGYPKENLFCGSSKTPALREMDHGLEGGLSHQGLLATLKHILECIPGLFAPPRLAQPHERES